MDALYSYGLLIALVVGAAAFLSAALARVLRLRPSAPRWVRASLVLLIVASVSLLASLLVHRGWGHGPGSLEPMRLGAFVSAHPAFVGTGALLVGAAALTAVARRGKNSGEALPRDLHLLAIAGVAAVAGLWLGEHQSSILPVQSLVVAACLAGAAALLLWRAHRGGAVVAALLVAFVFAVPWWAGANESTYAFNDCVHQGEEVREALASYRVAHGRFPAELAELDMHLPGRLILPPHTLRYRRTETGYELSFSDWLVRHLATESQAFMAHK